MARLPRLAVGGRLHLLIQRGHNGQPVFTDADDRRSYLQHLRDAAQQQLVAVHAYALADTELLLLATPTDGESLGRMMQAVSRRFVRAHNLRHGRSGALWEGRFASTVVDPAAHGVACLRLVDGACAPPGDGTAAAGDADAWSSAPHRSGGAKSPWLTEPLPYWHLGNTPFEREARYRQWLAEPMPAQERNLLRNAALKGWVLGDAAFTAALAEQTARRLAPAVRGRPRKLATERAINDMSPLIELSNLATYK